MSKTLEIVFKDSPYSNSSELCELANFAENLEKFEGLSTVKVNFSTKESKLTNLLSILERSNMPCGFDIDHPYEHPSKLISIRYIQREELNISCLFIKDFDKLIEHKVHWLTAILMEPSFIHCQLFDTQFDKIQNKKNIKYYESSGIDHSHLPKIDNGKKFPFNAIEVDTSVNPSYRKFRQGFIECIGHEMWLGKPFFERVNLNPEDVLSCAWLETLKLDNDVIYLKAYHKPFDSAVGKQADIQIKLRELLFSRCDF